MIAPLELSAPPRIVSAKPASATIPAEAVRRLQRNAYLRGRPVFCQFESGTLFLLGQVETFHQKQLAQTAVADLAGVARVVNEIRVRPAKAR